MEPLNEKELNQLLRVWEAPSAPKGLRSPAGVARAAWWRWLFTGSIRIPVPAVAAAAVVLVAIWV